LDPENPLPVRRRFVEYVHDDPSGVLPHGANLDDVPNRGAADRLFEEEAVLDVMG
jgi:hypothetical protein